MSGSSMSGAIFAALTELLKLWVELVIQGTHARGEAAHAKPATASRNRPHA